MNLKKYATAGTDPKDHKKLNELEKICNCGD
jgi:hypothetical protein